jgi:hypothetical protein
MSLPAPSASPAALSAAPAAVAAPGRCENCGNEVTQRYCGACGQRMDAPVHTLWHFSQLAAEDLTHADSRLWRTLAALLFKPGFLTGEFLAGRRARYLPPVRLYLVLSVAFFLFAAAVQPRDFTVVKIDGKHPANSRVIDPVKDKDLPESGLLVPRPGESNEQRADRLCKDADYDGPWKERIGPLVPQTCRKIVEDSGRHLPEVFLHNVPRAMFVFLPLIAGIMVLLYWRPRRYYVEHLLLLVHNHAFVFLALMLAWSVGLLVGGLPAALKFALAVYFLWYMYRSMRVVYAQRRLLTASKLVLLVFFYLVLGGVTLVATSLYSAVTL